MPQIEIWNLDIIDAVQPAMILGGSLNDVYTHGQKPVKGAHTDAIMSLSFNRLNPIYLASGSADTKVKIWDINEEKCVQTFIHHNDKVNVVQWNPASQDVLLTAGFDGVANILSTKDNSKVTTKIRKNLEKAKWHTGKEHMVNFTFEDGFIQVFDTRNFAKPVFEFQAHQTQCTSLTICPSLPNLVATCSSDETVKVWDFNQASSPQLVYEKQMKVGELFSCEFYEDAKMTLACGGNKGTLAIWDLEENRQIMKHFLGVDIPDAPVQEEEENFEKGKEEDDSDHEVIASKPKEKKSKTQEVMEVDEQESQSKKKKKKKKSKKEDDSQ